MQTTKKPSGSTNSNNPCSTIAAFARKAILDERTVCFVYPNGDVVIADTASIPTA